MLYYDGAPVREQFDMVGDVVYLRAANICPCPRSVAQAVNAFTSIWQSGGDACWTLAEAAFEEGKVLFAELVGAEPGEIATVENTSMGISMAATLIAPGPGTNIVVDDLTYPSDVFPWMIRPEVELRYAKSEGGRVSLNAFEALVDDKTAAINVCHVTMGHGFRHNLAQLATLAHRHDAYLVIDGAQSVGAVPIDVAKEQVDFLSVPTFKWLFGPLGAGFLYVRKDLLTLGPPPVVGWMSARNPEDFDVFTMHLHDDARRLQRGVHNAVGLVAAVAGLRIITALGTDNIWEHIRMLSQQLLNGLNALGLEVLTPFDDNHRAGIVTFRVPDAARCQAALERHRVLVGQYLPEQIRMDVSLYHDEEDIVRTLGAVAEVIR